LVAVQRKKQQLKQLQQQKQPLQQQKHLQQKQLQQQKQPLQQQHQPKQPSNLLGINKVMLTNIHNWQSFTQERMGKDLCAYITGAKG
jgi:response regulator of citrate/malate metabolism